MKLKENIPQNSDIKDKRIHLENSITHVLDPWMDKAEENLFATGLRKVPEEKLAQMEQFLQQENTPAQNYSVRRLFRFYKKRIKKILCYTHPRNVLSNYWHARVVLRHYKKRR